jgi:hypothetical protein
LTDVRRWLVPAGVGMVVGLLAGRYWVFADRFGRGCEEHPCWFPVWPLTWAVAVVLIPMICWLLLVVAGWRRSRGLWAFPVAMLGAVILGLSVRTYEAFIYGSPRPPYAVLAALGAASLPLAVAVLAGGRTRLAGAGLGVVLVAGLVAGEVASPHRDRLHRFTELAAVAQLPDPARWRVTAAEGHLRYDAIELRLTPVGGGPALLLFEVPVPSAWRPPQSCGPTLISLAVARTARSKVPEPGCTAYPGGGWQRIYPSGPVDLLDVRAGALLLTGAEWDDQPVSPAVQREMLTSLRPATPGQMAALPAR